MLMYLFCISGEIFWKVFGVHATVRRLFRGEDECSLSEGLCSLSEGLEKMNARLAKVSVHLAKDWILGKTVSFWPGARFTF